MQQNTNIRTWIENCGEEWVQCLDLEADRVSTALILAIKFGDFESTQILASSQDVADARDDEGDWTALMYAVNEACFKTVKLLVDLGANVNCRGTLKPDADFALNLAALGRNPEIFDFLLPLTAPELQEIAVKTLARR